MKVVEIFESIQGESTWVGRPCVFVRLSGCNLACSYCDTPQARNGAGVDMEVEEVLERIRAYPPRVVELTGGEPLLQTEVPQLAERLLDAGYAVLCETNGSLNIDLLDRRVCRIMDIKTPGSGMAEHFDPANLARLGPGDEVKFVLCDYADYEWARHVVLQHDLVGQAEILMSPAHGILDPRDLAEWLLADALDARLQIQAHKYIWGPAAHQR